MFDCFFMAGLSYAISLILPNEMIYETVMNAVALPIFFLSSALFPTEELKGGLAIAVFFNPFTHVIHILQDLIFERTILIHEVLPVICLLAGMCAFIFILDLWLLKKEMIN